MGGRPELFDHHLNLKLDNKIKVHQGNLSIKPLVGISERVLV